MPWGFLTVMALLFAVGGLIYLYARHLGRGDVRVAFDDPHERKKIIIVGAVLAAFAGLILLILVLTNIISF